MCYGPGMKYMRRTIETVEYFDDELEIPEGFPDVVEVPSYPALEAPKPSLLGRIAKWTCIGGVAWLTFLVIMGGAHARTLSPAEKSFPDSAHPTKMPWKYQGIWCDANNDNHRPKGFDSNRPWKYTCEESEQQIDFMDDHWNSDTNDVCHYTSFKRTKAFLEVGLQCPNFPVFKARFYPNKIVVLPIKKPVEFCFSAIREDGHVVRGKCVKSQD
jgi:hypothetical protein